MISSILVNMGTSIMRGGIVNIVTGNVWERQLSLMGTSIMGGIVNISEYGNVNRGGIVNIVVIVTGNVNYH